MDHLCYEPALRVSETNLDVHGKNPYHCDKRPNPKRVRGSYFNIAKGSSKEGKNVPYLW